MAIRVDQSPAPPAPPVRGGVRISAPPIVVSQRTMMIGQGLYYFLGGVWPLLAMNSFLAVTGPKTDLWLVQTVGVLVAVIGGVLLLAARHPTAPTEVVALAIGAAVALTVVDVTFVIQGRIPPIYLLDASA